MRLLSRKAEIGLRHCGVLRLGPPSHSLPSIAAYRPFFQYATSPPTYRSLEVLLAFIYLGVFPSFVSFLIWNRSILTFGPSRTTLVYNSLPLFAVILSVFFLHETIHSYQIVGGIVLLAGVLLGTLERPPAMPNLRSHT